MPKQPVLTDAQIDEALQTTPGWRRAGGEIEAKFSFETFPAAVAFVTRVADLAEAANHHPDIDIRYRTVSLRLATHDSGGITALDIELARRINGAVSQ